MRDNFFILISYRDAIWSDFLCYCFSEHQMISYTCVCIEVAWLYEIIMNFHKLKTNWRLWPWFGLIWLTNLNFHLILKLTRLKMQTFHCSSPYSYMVPFIFLTSLCEYSCIQRLTLPSLHGLSFQSRIEDILTVIFFMDRNDKGLLQMFLQLLPKAIGLAVTNLNSTKFSLYEIIWEMYEIVLFGGT